MSKLEWHSEKRKVSELLKWPQNPREIREKDFKDLQKSIDRFGLAEPLVIQPDGLVIGGHARLEALKAKGESECDCYVPNRELNQDELAELNIRLNKNIAGTWDLDLLSAFPEDLLKDVGFTDEELSDMFQLDMGGSNGGPEELDDTYTKKITAPIYEPKGEKPDIENLFDMNKSNELIEEIKASDIPEKEKSFLIEAAKRHTIFNYHNIADYYAHSSPEVQELMEKSALVIIDFQKAIENGYVRLSQDIMNNFIEDYPDVDE